MRTKKVYTFGADANPQNLWIYNVWIWRADCIYCMNIFKQKSFKIANGDFKLVLCLFIFVLAYAD